MNTRAIVLWLLRFLETNLDTDLKARLEAYRLASIEVQGKIAVEQAGLAQDNARLEETQKQRQVVQAQVAQIETQIGRLKEEVKNIDAETRPDKSIPAGDALRDRL